MQSAAGTTFVRCGTGGTWPASAPPVIVQLRRSPANPSSWLLSCSNFYFCEDATMHELLAALAVQPQHLARLLLEECAVALRTVRAWPLLPGVTRLVLDYSLAPLDQLLPKFPRLQARPCSSAGAVCRRPPLQRPPCRLARSLQSKPLSPSLPLLLAGAQPA